MPENAIKRSKKPLAVAAIVALLLAGGGAAYAYWTTTGAGTGTATTGTNSAIVVNQTSTISNLRPGGTAQPLAGNFTNTTNNGGTVYVANVVATLTNQGVVKAAGAAAGTCDASDYVISNGTIPVNADIASGTGVGSWGTGVTPAPSIAFVNKATNQDACKGATVTITYTAN